MRPTVRSRFRLLPSWGREGLLGLSLQTASPKPVSHLVQSGLSEEGLRTAEDLRDHDPQGKRVRYWREASPALFHVDPTRLLARNRSSPRWTPNFHAVLRYPRCYSPARVTRS